MKRRNSPFWIGMGVMAALFFSVIPVGAEEGERLADPVRPVQSERDLGTSDRSSSVGPQERGGGNLDETLLFEVRGETTPPEREAEALQFHQNTTLERFESTDEHGRLFLTFSAEGIDLRLRSITGAEASVAEVLPEGE